MCGKALITFGGKVLNIFKLDLGDDPREVLNLRLWLAVTCFGMMGAARGVDEGLITGTLSSKAFQEHIGLSHLDETEFASAKGNIISMVQLGSILGAVVYVDELPLPFESHDTDQP